MLHSFPLKRSPTFQKTLMSLPYSFLKYLVLFWMEFFFIHDSESWETGINENSFFFFHEFKLINVPVHISWHWPSMMPFLHYANLQDLYRNRFILSDYLMIKPVCSESHWVPIAYRSRWGMFGQASPHMLQPFNFFQFK